jgi:hypothetical protein
MAVLVLVLVFVLISFDPPRVLFLAFSSYAASGIVTWVLKHRKGEKVFAPSDDESESSDSVSGSARDKMSN